MKQLIKNKISLSTVLSLGFIALGSLVLSTEVQADTRFGLGFGGVKYEQYQIGTERDGSIRLSIEQKLNSRWSVQLAHEGSALPIFFTDSFSNKGVYVKYKLSETPKSFFVKTGISKFEQERFSWKNSYVPYKKSNSPNIGIGWQNLRSSGFGFEAELWYTDLSRNNLVGLTVTASYGFNWFN